MKMDTGPRDRWTIGGSGTDCWLEIDEQSLALPVHPAARCLSIEPAAGGRCPRLVFLDSMREAAGCRAAAMGGTSVARALAGVVSTVRVRGSLRVSARSSVGKLWWFESGALAVSRECSVGSLARSVGLLRVRGSCCAWHDRGPRDPRFGNRLRGCRRRGDACSITVNSWFLEEWVWLVSWRGRSRW